MKRKNNPTITLTPEQALQFLEDFRKMRSGVDEVSQPISIRIPQNILRAFKTLAKTRGSPYQSLMLQALREYLNQKS